MVKATPSGAIRLAGIMFKAANTTQNTNEIIPSLIFLIAKEPNTPPNTEGNI